MFFDEGQPLLSLLGIGQLDSRIEPHVRFLHASVSTDIAAQSNQRSERFFRLSQITIELPQIDDLADILAPLIRYPAGGR